MHTNDSSVDVVVSWAGTTLAVERLAPGEVFTVGPRGTFCCDHPAVPEPAFALVAHGPSGARLARAPGMQLLVDGRTADVAAVDLAPGPGNARVVLGPLTFDVRFDRASAPANSRTRRDTRFLAASGVALALQAGLVAAFLVARAPLPAELPMPTSATARAHFVVPSRPTVTSSDRPTLAASRTPALAVPHRRTHASPRPRATAAELARGALAALGLGAPSAPTLPGLGGGLQGLQAAKGAGMGAEGLGTRDIGSGGAPGSTVDLGGYRVRPGGPPDGAPWGLVAGEKRPSVRIVVDSDPIGDGLSRDEIQRVISRALPRIRYCYERELGAAPDLEGKVTSSFVIGRDGTVATASSAHTMAVPAVAGCVDGVVRSLAFPAPHGGGQVVVTYPFVFTLAGG